MHRIFVYVLLSVFALLAVERVSARVDVSEERNGKLVVDVHFDARDGSLLNTPGLPPLRYERFYVALPIGGAYRVTRIGGVPLDRRGEVPKPVANLDPTGMVPTVSPGPGFYPSRAVVASDPFIFRKTRIIAVDCYATQVDYDTDVERVWPGYRVEVSYAPLGAYVTSDKADPLVAGTVINRSFLPSPLSPAARGRENVQSQNGVPDPHFSLSENWVKIRVDTAGVYAIEGADLTQLGVDLDREMIDPESFRLFTLGGRAQERRNDAGEPYQDENGTWKPGNWMTECDILVENEEVLTFEATDRIIFYALGTRGWMDLYEPGAPREAHHDHLYTKGNVYYLTWNDSPGFPGEPGRMDVVGAAPSPTGPDVTRFEERLYFEVNRVEALSYGGDGYRWLEVAHKNYPETFRLLNFDVRDLAPEQQTFRTIALAPYKRELLNENHHAEYLINGEQIAEKVFDNKFNDGYESAVPVVTTGLFLQDGSNDFRLRVPRDIHPDDFMYFEFFEIFYPRETRARNNRLFFCSPDTTGSVTFRVRDFYTDPQVYLFDVTDQFHPRILDGFEETDLGVWKQVRFSSTVGVTRQYYAAVGSDAFDRPADMTLHLPKDLRNASSSPHMLIVTHPDFIGDAERFKRHREVYFPLSSNPDIEVVTTEEVFDNFSGGLVDPMAIRNYCKFLYDNYSDGNGFPLLSFLLLLGDANMDYKNYITSQENLVTTNLNLEPYSSDAYATDDWFVELEPPDSVGVSYNQIAVGRLPAGSRSAASFLVDRVIDYETVAEFGPWRDRAILVADDEKTPSHPPQPDFVTQSENIAHTFLAPFLEPHKIYLTEYPMIGSIKPASRLDFLEAWNDGALIINFIGHGSSVQMADEQVFLGTDVANLRNGLRLPFFMAFSCTIGDFGRAQTISLSEKLLLWEEGGAVAAVTASEVSFIQPNASLNSRMFAEASPLEPGSPQPLGVALLKAKTGALANSDSKRLVGENNQKYNLLGDPALRLASPRRAVVFEGNDVDTLTTGKRHVIRGTVYENGAVDTGFNGNVHLVIREPDDDSGYRSEDGLTYIQYRYPGGTVYEGTADITAGKFEFNIKIPRFAGTGPWAFVRAYADNGIADVVALSDTTYFAAPSPGDTTVLHPLDGPPRVEMGFEGKKTIVKPGAVLEAVVNDADGVNILNTTPAGKIALVFDQTNLPVDVTDSFQYDHGGTDTSGVLSYPLPGLSVGDHRVILKVGDSFGQVTLDTLEFAMTDPMDYAADVLFNYPNPFTTSTHFLLNLTDPADVEIDIFTVSGKRIRRLKEREDAGEAWVLWDGRDSVGDTIANGTYLYVARVTFVGLDRPPVVLRGKVVKIE